MRAHEASEAPLSAATIVTRLRRRAAGNDRGSIGVPQEGNRLHAASVALHRMRPSPSFGAALHGSRQTHRAGAECGIWRPDCTVHQWCVPLRSTVTIQQPGRRRQRDR